MFVWFFLIVFVYVVKAEYFTYLQPSDGLISGEINHIIEDAQGRIWMATWSGLVCYNGHTFSNYRPVLGNKFSMPDKKVKKLLLDSNGNLWIATEKNLVRFNMEKNRFETFSFYRDSNDPINILFINQLDNYLLIHSVEGFYRIPIGQVHSDDYKIMPIAVHGENYQNVYFHLTASLNNMFYAISNNQSSNSSSIYGMYFHFDGKDTSLLVDYTNGLNVVVNDIYCDSVKSKMILSTTNGVLIYDHLARGVSEHFFNNQRIRTALMASDGRIYASGYDVKLLSYDYITASEKVFLANPNLIGNLLNSVILCLFNDFSGNLWIGHQGQGISIMNLNRKAFYTFRHDPFNDKSIRSNAVMCFNGNRDYIIVGLRTGGLNVSRIDHQSISELSFERIGGPLPVNGKTINAVWDIAKQNDSVFWVGHSGGLSKLSLKKESWQISHIRSDDIFESNVRKIFIDRNNNLWCGSMKHGLVFIPNPDGHIKGKAYSFMYDRNDSSSISDNVVTDILIDSNSRLWVATGNGLNLMEQDPYNFSWDGKQKPVFTFKRIVGGCDDGSSLNNNEINSISENYGGKIWIATQGGGINIFDPERNRFIYINQNQGLPGNDVMGVVKVYNNQWWISTEKGLSHLTMQDDVCHFSNYSSTDGLQSDVFLVNSFYKADNGLLFFGGENGFTTFYPDEIVLNKIPPKIVLSNLMFGDKVCNVGEMVDGKCILEKSFNQTEQIVLPYKNNTFSIGVSALHYQYPKGNKVVYTLHDYYKRWHILPSDQAYISFTQLPAGKYVLEAYALSADNARSDSKKLTITVLPPWYKSVYMIVVYLIASMAIITIAILVFFNRQREQFQKRIYAMTMENNESKMLFLANLAHELKTPVNLIVSPIEDMIINKNELNTKWHNHIYLMHRNARYIMKLINQIIDFRKMDSGNLKLNLQHENMVQLINDVSINFKAFEKQKNVELKLKLPENPVYLNVDSNKIDEVLYNLLSNAFKHTPPNHFIEVEFEISKIPHDDNSNGEICIKVFNEGSSLPIGDEEQIFERFYKSNDKVEGAGIGLSFAKSLVDLHNGRIWAENIPEKGVAFFVTLPYSKADSMYVANKTNRKIMDPEDKIRRDLLRYDSDVDFISADKLQTKVLIVEDNDDLRRYMFDLLSRIYTCYEADNGEKAFELAVDIVPDIVITDIVMPKIDGFQLLRRIKEDIRTCHIPVIMLTAKNSSENMIAGYKTGVDAYIVKPFETGVMLSQIAQLVKNRKLIHEKYKQQNFMVEVSTQNLTRDDVFLKKVKKLLDKHIANPDFNVKELSAELNMSTTQLYRKIKALTNYSPVEFLRITRLHKAHDLLIKQNYSIKEVSFLTGFNNLSYFVKCFREYFNVTPANFRDKMWPVD